MELGEILIFFLLAAGLAGGMVFVTVNLGPKRPSKVKNAPFECGMVQKEPPQGRVSVKFYLIAMLFIIFDIELVFLFPWAVVFRRLGWFAFFEMLMFLSLVFVGFAYAWKKGALDWD